MTAEIRYMVDPVVTVIAGPGDAAAEQAMLSNLAYTNIKGNLQLTMGETTFDLEVIP